MTEEENAGAGGTMDAILLDVLWNRLVGVVNEQAAALMRTSFTSVLREAGDLRLESFALREKGILIRGRDFAEGKRCLARAMHLAEKSGDNLAIGRASISLAWTALIQGNCEGAIELFHRARKQSALDGDRSWMATCYMGLCEAYARAGNNGQARQYGEHAVATATGEGGQARIGEALLHLGRVELVDGNPAVGLNMLRRALQALERAGLQEALISTHNLLGEAARKAGRFDTAEESYREAVAIAEAVEPVLSWQPRLNLGLLAMEAGRFAGARVPIEGARQILGEHEALDVLEKTVAPRDGFRASRHHLQLRIDPLQDPRQRQDPTDGIAICLYRPGEQDPAGAHDDRVQRGDSGGQSSRRVHRSRLPAMRPRRGSAPARPLAEGRAANYSAVPRGKLLLPRSWR